MKTVCILLMMLLSTSISFGQQVFYNSGASINIQGNETVLIQGGVTNTNNGTFTNAGTINVSGDWINNAGNVAFSPTTSGTVILSGGSQLIDGSNLTNFNNLKLGGTNIKSLGVNSAFDGTLDLSNIELATNNYIMTCNNTSPSAIQRTTGFISSNLTGNISRKTADISSFLFPVGSSTGSLRYRPVTLTPVTAGQNTYSVSFINHNPTNDTLNVLSFTSPICIVNPNFYYKINRTNGTDAVGLKLYFDNVADGNYSLISHWQNSLWNNAGVATLTSNTSPVLSYLSLNYYNNFNTDNFDIASPAVNGLQLISQYNDTIFASPGTAYQWYLNGNIINGATNAYYVPPQTGNYSVSVTSSGNCTVTSANYYFVFVGISENSNMPAIHIYPNPFSSYITVDGYNESGNLQISLTNVMGQEIAKHSVDGTGYFKFDLKPVNASPGVYLLRIANEKSNNTYKIIKL